MEMVLRPSAARIDCQRNNAVRNILAILLAHEIARLPGQPEEIRRVLFHQQRTLGAVNAVSRHQQILQRAIAIFKDHISGIGFHFGTWRRVLMLQLVGQALLKDNLTQRIRVSGQLPVAKTCRCGNNDNGQ